MGWGNSYEPTLVTLFLAKMRICYFTWKRKLFISNASDDSRHWGTGLEVSGMGVAVCGFMISIGNREQTILLVLFFFD